MENHFDLVNRMIQILVESLNVDGALEEAALYEKRYAILLKIKDLLSFFSSEPKDHVAHQQFVTIAKTQGRYILKQIFYELKHSNSLSYNRLLASLLQSSAYRELVGIHLDFSVASLIQIIEPGSEEKPEFNALPILGDILADHTLGPLSAPAKREILKFLNKIKRGKIDFLESSVLSQQVKNVTQTLLNRDRLKQTVAACRAALKSSD